MVQRFGEIEFAGQDELPLVCKALVGFLIGAFWPYCALAHVLMEADVDTAIESAA